MTSIIDSMVKQKLVKRIPHLSDRRRILIEITEKGHKAAVEFKNRIVERFHQSMDSSKQKAVLEKISAALTLIEEVEFKA
jgi:DNA-binding MarR family transcriptional regulator